MEDSYRILNMTEGKDDHIMTNSGTSSASNRNVFGLLPLFLLIVLVVLRVSWTLYRSFGTIAYISVLFTLLAMSFIIMCIKIGHMGQKTRSAPQRRPAARRPSPGEQDPTIYISPSNLPPPPKYEYMAPPSYEEVVGVHYPQYTPQPIVQPISAALAQGSSQPDNVTSVTVIDEPRRTSVTVART